MALKIKTINWDASRLPAGVNTKLFMVVDAIKGTDWGLSKWEAKTYKLIIERRDCKMSIYLSTMTIQTALHHPTKGKTQLTRNKVTQGEFKALIKNPRLHTGKGHY